MTRILVFDGDRAEKRFELIRTAILLAGDGKGERTRVIIRKEARLLDALDKISDFAPLLADPEKRVLADPDRRVLKPEGGTLEITQEDFELLQKYVDETPWLPHAARAAVDVQDWVSAAERKD